MFRAAFFAKSQRLAGARLYPAMADVADPETEGRIAGDADGGVKAIRPKPACRGQPRRCRRRGRESAVARGHEPRMAAGRWTPPPPRGVSGNPPPPPPCVLP